MPAPVLHFEYALFSKLPKPAAGVLARGSSFIAGQIAELSFLNPLHDRKRLCGRDRMKSKDMRLLNRRLVQRPPSTFQTIASAAMSNISMITRCQMRFIPRSGISSCSDFIAPLGCCQLTSLAFFEFQI